MQDCHGAQQETAVSSPHLKNRSPPSSLKNSGPARDPLASGKPNDSPLGESDPENRQSQTDENHSNKDSKTIR